MSLPFTHHPYLRSCLCNIQQQILLVDLMRIERRILDARHIAYFAPRLLAITTGYAICDGFQK